MQWLTEHRAPYIQHRIKHILNWGKLMVQWWGICLENNQLGMWILSLTAQHACLENVCNNLHIHMETLPKMIKWTNPKSSEVYGCWKIVVSRNGQDTAGLLRKGENYRDKNLDLLVTLGTREAGKVIMSWCLGWIWVVWENPRKYFCMEVLSSLEHRFYKKNKNYLCSVSEQISFQHETSSYVSCLH